MDIHFSTDLIMQSQPVTLSVFIKNYDMGGIVKPLNELHYMVEEFVRRVPEILALNKESEIVMKEQRQGQEQRKGQEQSSSWEQEHVQTSKSFYTTTDMVCFHCNGKWYFKRDCQEFLEEQKAAKAASTSGVNVDWNFLQLHL